MSGKWLELLKEIAPGLTRVGVLRDPTMTAGVGEFAAIQAVALSSGWSWSDRRARRAEIERAIPIFARGQRRPDRAGARRRTSSRSDHQARGQAPIARSLFLPLLRDRWRFDLLRVDSIDPFRRAAEYIDRILKGEKPSELPVQAPTKYEW